ncbi:hypothetical protein EYF80_024842 [Liparis tanakae]|uniref:Uncharacterized protein n=1 Tax=Liparis tanakae TaxID=230148 RepID=A0A4Z2HGF3_9TELE|nr:hypothetical protein EYF80_024842 [Liparis tanakae]
MAAEDIFLCKNPDGSECRRHGTGNYLCGWSPQLGCGPRLPGATVIMYCLIAHEAGCLVIRRLDLQTCENSAPCHRRVLCGQISAISDKNT